MLHKQLNAGPLRRSAPYYCQPAGRPLISPGPLTRRSAGVAMSITPEQANGVEQRINSPLEPRQPEKVIEWSALLEEVRVRGTGFC